jgi:LacI family transcriptional regulator
MGNKAAKMLIDRLEEEHERKRTKKKLYTTEVIETHLIERIH